MSTIERLAAGSAPAERGCIVWTRGTFGASGYGAIWHEGRTRLAHRVAYELAHGPIPAGRLVRHACDNRPCVNPAHLVLGDYSDNARDCIERGRKATGHYSVMAKLADADVAEIRELYASGQWSQRGLAARFGVTQARIWQVVHHRARTSPSLPGIEFRPATEAS